MIRTRYIFTLLTLAIVFYFAPANAQTKKTTKKPAKKTEAKKTPQKPAAKKPTTAAAKTDTTKKGGAKANNPQDKTPASLSEEIVVTTAYKPVLADAVKIRR